MSRGTFFTVAIAAVLSSQAYGAVSLQYGSSMPPEQIDRLNKDLQALSSMSFADASGELQRIMKLPDTKAASLESWLAERARFVVGEKFEIASAIVPVERIQVASIARRRMDPLSALSNLSAVAGTSALTPEPVVPGGTTGTAPEREARVIMSNLGAGLFSMGKQNGFVLGVKLEGESGVVLRSPRVGLFQVGEGLFQTLDPRLPASALADFVHIAFRMQTLFHESRHDDGNNSSLAFGHVACPSGHNLEGLPACDTPSNGPYRIGAMFLKGLIEGCGTNCPAGIREVLTMLYADNVGRILTPMPQPTLALATDLCTRMNAVDPHNNICNAPAVAATVVEWDDAPEVIAERP